VLSGRDRHIRGPDRPYIWVPDRASGGGGPQVCLPGVRPGSKFIAAGNDSDHFHRDTLRPGTCTTPGSRRPK
jgi:hypothetical protein